MKSRRKSREYALQVLFQTEYEPSRTADEALAAFRETYTIDEENWPFATELITGVFEHIRRLDDVIQSHSTHWKIDRMPMVDRNVLRIGVYEMLYRTEDVPRKVVIDEAIEIARSFGSTDSSSFINGILDNVGRSY
jgi:N utilization substance protein B